MSRDPTDYSDKEAMKRIWRYFFISKYRLVAVAFLIIIAIVTSVVLPYIISFYIDTVLINRETSIYGTIIVIYITIYIVSLVVQYLQRWYFAIIGENAVLELRHDVIEKLQYHSQDYFDYNSTGDTLSRLTNDIDNLQSILSGNLLFSISSIITIMGMVIVMLTQSIILTFVVLLAIPMGLLANRLNEYFVRPVIKSSYKLLGEVSSSITENIQGAKVSAAFARVEENTTEFREKNHALSHQIYLLFRNAGLVQPLFELFGPLMIVIVLTTGIVLTITGISPLTIGILYLFISYTQSVSSPVRDLAQLGNSVQNSFEAFKRLLSLIDTPSSVDEKDDAYDLNISEGRIQFKSVICGYNNRDDQVLENFNLEIDPQEVIALVGATGAGKSTITKLITRLYDINSGSIIIDGQDIQDVTISSLRKLIGFILQEPILFEMSIRENLNIAANLKDDQLYDLLDLVGASFVKELPQKLDTQVGERGSRLSQGERQLLCFARTLAIDPKILILDEATSSIDPQAELRIQQAMDKMFEDRTSIIIAHRLSTVKKADRIIVLSGGEIIEEGPMKELLETKGAFYELYNLQFS